jgi:hypothetical protein
MLSGLSSTPHSQQKSAYESARNLANRFYETTDLEVHVEETDVNDDSSEDEDDSVVLGAKKSSLFNDNVPPSINKLSSKLYFNDILCDPPLNIPNHRRMDAPTWLQDAQQIRKITNRLVYETMGE